jgi:hypothetical protein
MEKSDARARALECGSHLRRLGRGDARARGGAIDDFGDLRIAVHRVRTLRFRQRNCFRPWLSSEAVLATDESPVRFLSVCT